MFPKTTFVGVTSFAFVCLGSPNVPLIVFVSLPVRHYELTKAYLTVVAVRVCPG